MLKPLTTILIAATCLAVAGPAMATESVPHSASQNQSAAQPATSVVGSPSLVAHHMNVTNKSSVTGGPGYGEIGVGTKRPGQPNFTDLRHIGRFYDFGTSAWFTLGDQFRQKWPDLPTATETLIGPYSADAGDVTDCTAYQFHPVLTGYRADGQFVIRVIRNVESRETIDILPGAQGRIKTMNEQDLIISFVSLKLIEGSEGVRAVSNVEVELVASAS